MRRDIRKDQREVWVVHHLLSGAVRAVYFRQPPANVFDLREYGTVKTWLSEWAIARSHQLRVDGGRVVHAPSLSGI